MGLFGFGKKKNNGSNVRSSAPDGYMEVMNNSLFRDITQEVAIAMKSYGIVQQPALQFFNDDGDILQGLVLQHTSNPQLLAFKSQDIGTYLFICGMHAFGAGVYVTLQQSKFQKPVNEFTTAEKMQIANDFDRTDSYELALNTLGIPLDSKNKQVIDHIIMVARDTALKAVGREVAKQGNIWAYMQVLFNAGITMVLR